MTAYKAELGLMCGSGALGPAARGPHLPLRRRTRMPTSLVVLASRFDRDGGRVVAEDLVDLYSVLRKRQPQPEQHDMVASWRRSADHAVQWRTVLRHPGVDVVPIISASAGKHPVDPLAGDLHTINVAEPCAGQSEPRLAQAFGQVDKPDTWKKLGDAEGIDVGAGRHPPGTCCLQPIIVDLTLTLRHQLSPKSPF